jgi:transcriptional regulator GlxA family with amidase domain
MPTPGGRITPTRDSSANALSRAFQQRIGQTPSDWLRQREAA